MLSSPMSFSPPRRTRRSASHTDHSAHRPPQRADDMHPPTADYFAPTYHDYTTLPLPSTSYLPPSTSPHLSSVLTTALGSPFLTTTDADLPPRPSSPAPTADYSLIEPDPEYGSLFPNVFLPGTYYPYAVPTIARQRASQSMPALGRGYQPTPGQWIGGGWTQQQQHHNPLRAILPKLWDVLSFPGRSVLTTLANVSTPSTSSSSSNSSFSSWSTPTTPVNYIDYADLPPLDGEEGELIDDEACCVEQFEDANSIHLNGSGREYGYGGHYGYREVRVATGIDILSLLPPELGLYTLTFLCSQSDDLHTLLACQLVSKSWHTLADDNHIWKILLTTRWGIDLSKARKDKDLPQLPPEGRMSVISATPSRAPLQLNWKRMYTDRMELERRWMGTARVPSRARYSGVDIPSGAMVNLSARGTAEGGWEKWEPKVMRIRGHSDSVYCLEFDSTRIITGSRDRSIKVWSLRTGVLLGNFIGAHQGSVLCLKFEKDWEQKGKKGFMVSGSSDCTICVWELELGDEVQGERCVRGNVRAVLKGHAAGVLDLRIDERWIVSCAKDTTIHIYDRRTLTLHRVLRGHEGPVNAVGLQGNNIVSASGDGKMILWDILSGERKRTFDGHDRGLACIEFRGGTIVSGSNDCRIKVWDAATGECKRTLVGHRALVRALALGEGGRLVSGSYDKTVRVWDLESGKCVRAFEGMHMGHVFDVRFDVGRIVSTSHDHNIVVLDFSDGLKSDTALFV